MTVDKRQKFGTYKTSVPANLEHTKAQSLQCTNVNNSVEFNLMARELCRHTFKTTSQESCGFRFLLNLEVYT